MIAARLHGEQAANPLQKNRYKTWIENYIADDYCAAVEKGRGAKGRSCHDILVLTVFT
jgi:thiaminase